MSEYSMRSQSRNTPVYPKFQTMYHTILDKVEELYFKFVPKTIRLRRNVNQQKQLNTVIIATIIRGIMLGFPTQFSTYQAVCTFLYPDDFPSYSRYCRLSGNLKETLKIIRYEYVKILKNQAKYAVIDSFPCPSCAIIRNRWAKLFSVVANIGYNARIVLLWA